MHRPHDVSDIRNVSQIYQSLEKTAEFDSVVCIEAQRKWRQQLGEVVRTQNLYAGFECRAMTNI